MSLRGLLLVAAALFTAAFNYFGRPPLVIQGMVNTGLLLNGPVASYSLGDAQWGWGTVTYPFKVRGNMESCAGTVTLQ